MVGIGDVRQSLMKLGLLNEMEGDAVCGAIHSDRDGFVHYPELLVALRAAMKHSKAPLHGGTNGATNGSVANGRNMEMLQERQRIMSELIKLGIDFEEAQFFDNEGTGNNDDNNNNNNNNNNGSSKDTVNFGDGGVEGKEEEMFAPSRRLSLDPRLNKMYGDRTLQTDNGQELRETVLRWKLLNGRNGPTLNTTAHRANTAKSPISKAKYRTLQDRLNVLNQVLHYRSGNNGSRGSRGSSRAEKEVVGEERRSETSLRDLEQQPPWKRWRQWRPKENQAPQLYVGNFGSPFKSNPQEEEEIAAAASSPSSSPPSSKRRGSVVYLSRGYSGRPQWIYDLAGEHRQQHQQHQQHHHQQQHHQQQQQRNASSVVVSMSEAAIIHYQVSTMLRVFHVLRDWADKCSWERAVVDAFQHRAAVRLVPHAYDCWQKAYRGHKYFTLRLMSKCIEGWAHVTHASKQHRKQMDIAACYHDLRRQVVAFRLWREQGARSTVVAHLQRTATAHWRTTLLHKCFNGLVESHQRTEVFEILTNRALLHYARSLAKKVLRHWRRAIVEGQRWEYYEDVYCQKLLAKSFALFRYNVEVLKDENKQVLHSNVYRRLFLLSRSYQQWRSYVNEQQRNHWVDGVAEHNCLKKTVVLWRAMGQQWRHEKHRLATSDMLYEMRVSKKYFHNWNALIHENHSMQVRPLLLLPYVVVAICCCCHMLLLPLLLLPLLLLPLLPLYCSNNSTLFYHHSSNQPPPPPPPLLHTTTTSWRKN